MDKEGEAEYPGPFGQKEYKIAGYGPIGMQGMKVDTTSIWIEHGACP